MKTSVAAPPPAPTPINPGQAQLDYITSITRPDVVQAQIDAERMGRPAYDLLNLQGIERYLYGTPEQQGVVGMLQRTTPQISAIEQAAASAQREADIIDVERLGSRAAEAFRAANPQLASAMGRADALAQTPSGILSGFQQAVAQPGQYEDLAFNPMQAAMASPAERIAAGQVDEGALGQRLYTNALEASGLGQVGGILQERAAEFARSQGRLTPDEIRSLQQATRERYAAQGTEMGSGAISAEALSRLANQRGRMMEDLTLAAQLNAGNQAELGANRQFQMGVQGANVQRQFGNVANQLQAASANQQAGLSVNLANQQAANQAAMFNSQGSMAAQEANRDFRARQAQQNIANQGMLAQFGLGQLGADRSYALNLANMAQGTMSDPYMTILGRPAQAVGMAQGQQQYASGLMANLQGPQLFSPDAGINLGMQQNANLANYQAATYGARAAAQGAIVGGMFQGIGSALGCWVAREVFGNDNPLWVEFFHWKEEHAPKWFAALYNKHGEAFAAFIKDKPRLKNIIRKWMLARIASIRPALKHA